MKRLLTFLLALPLPASALAATPMVPSEVFRVPVSMLVDLGSGEVLVARRSDVSFLPASVTKVMTAYVAFEEIGAGRLPLNRTFVVPPEISREWFAKGTSMYLKPGQPVTTDALLHGIMTASANDASMVLAHGYAGTVETWSLMMNDAARRLGMTHSHYNTPNGWMDEGQTFVSARDLVRLADAMTMRYPRLYKHFSGQKRYRWQDISMRSHDPTVGVVPGADGIKTGYTREAGYNFLGSAERNGRRLVMVLAGARTHTERDAAAKALLEWGFTQWRSYPLFAEGATVARARVQDGSTTTVPLVANRALYATVPRYSKARVSMTLHYKGPLVAPVQKGSQVAEVEVKVDGVESSRIPLYAAQDVPVAGLLARMRNGLLNIF
ncbi:D-alanyl-D-alanine carboxypeptidase family protein [Novosphingobium sp. M1R2S20]|uniref:serine-type D-Ala-D-Ala carboxypeptidase n=1 Tax=Novosphingobium rhizovicinum TaxID=3228928 RepID=A0ABV3R9A4_9SPHN